MNIATNVDKDCENWSKNSENSENFKECNKLNLISIRSIEEHNGITSGYPYFNGKGRIIGDIYGFDINSYRNIDGTMLNYEIIEKNLWNKNGIYNNLNCLNIFYCGTGWRASETLFYAYLMNWKKITLYDGGWYEWSNFNNNFNNKSYQPLCSKM